MEEHINVADEFELTNRLQLFLASQGWTVHRYLTNVSWRSAGGGVYAFLSGTALTDNEVFLEFSSNGYGNQVLHYRIRITGEAASLRYIYANMGYGDTSLDDSYSQNPVVRFKPWSPSPSWVNHPFSYNSSTYPMQTFVSNEPLPRVWFFGFDQKYICVVMQLDSQRVHYWHFGTMEMHDFNSEYGGFCHGFGNRDWKTSPQQTPFDYGYFYSFDEYSSRDGRNGSNANKLNFGMGTLDSNAHSDYAQAFAFNNAPRFLLNDLFYSELQTITRQLHYVIDPADGIWFYSGRSFWFRISAKNMRIGERFKISTEEYIAFPNFQVDLSKVGVAFRIG